MKKKKILIFKNDRGGDLFTSLKLISSLLIKTNDVKIYLSELNIGFSFFFKNAKINKINFNLNIFDKITIIIDLFLNKYDEIFILTPKNFYFFLPFLFKNIKFYAIVYENNIKNRPSIYQRKFLFNYKIVYRNKINPKSYRELQLDLLNDQKIIDHDYKNLYIPNISNKFKSLLPNNFLLFQFRYLFFEKSGWNIDDFNFLMKNILRKHEFILFTSDIEKNCLIKNYNDYFEKNFSIIDTSNYKNYINEKNKNIFYLKNIDAFNLFLIINESNINLAQHGIFSHISYFYKKKCHNLFNFEINSQKDIIHQKISYSEWYKGMNYSFSFINKDINKAIKKILKNI